MMACCDDGVSPHPEVAEFSRDNYITNMFFCFLIQKQFEDSRRRHGGQECVGDKIALFLRLLIKMSKRLGFRV